jgi:hypothetical protein
MFKHKFEIMFYITYFILCILYICSQLPQDYVVPESDVGFTINSEKLADKLYWCETKCITQNTPNFSKNDYNQYLSVATTKNIDFIKLKYIVNHKMYEYIDNIFEECLFNCNLKKNSKCNLNKWWNKKHKFRKSKQKYQNNYNQK